MSTLHLLRHAKSSWDDQTLADHERPLSPRGRRAAGKMCEHLAIVAAGLELVLCSSAARTRQTLELVAPGLGDARVEIDQALYGARAETLLRRLRAVPDDVGSLLMIGHNPGMQDLALDLAAGGPALPELAAKFPTCALATLALSEPWSALAAGVADLTAYVTPKQLP